MSLDWSEITIGDLGKIVTGKTPKTSIEDNYGGKILFLTPSDNMDVKYVYETNKTLTEQGLNEVKNCLIPKNSICVSCIGTVGNVVLTSEDTVTNQQINSIIVNDNFDYNFVYYLMVLIGKRLHFLSQTSTVVPIINKSSFSKELINVPPLDTQKKISSILSNIDDKIENLQNINKNLEKYLFYLFNEYFMEFDFNEFSNSNTKIPSSWKLGCFNDIIDSLGSGDWGKEEKTGNYVTEVYCIRGADIPDVKQGNKGKMPIRFILPKNFEKRRLNENSIVIEISGGSPTQSTGRTVFITDNFLNRFDKDIICTNFCKVINPKNEYAIFLYLYLNYLYDKDVMFAYENGTTGIKNFDIKSFIKNFLIVIPSIEDIIKFNNLVQDVFNITMHNGLEIEQLQKLRDTLLPKLMSGEIDVSQINCDLE